MSLRMERVNKQLQRRIMEVIQKEVDDPSMDFLSITRVITTKDLQESKVYFSLLNENSYDKAQKILDRMSGFIRGTLGKKVRLKVLPKLTFYPDEAIKYSIDVHEKLEKMKEFDNNEKDIRDNPEE